MSNTAPPPSPQPEQAPIAPAAGDSEALRAAAEQVRLAFEAIPDGVVIIDSNWRFTFANQRALEMVGRADILGKDIFELFPGNAEEPFNSTYRSTMATRRPSEFEAFNGEPLNTWFRVQAKPYTQDADNGIIVFFRNITEERTHQQARQVQQELLDSVQEAARVATWEFNIASGAVTWGPGAFEIFGHPFEEVSTLAQIERIVLPGYSDQLAGPIQHALAHGGAVRSEFPVAARDGSTLWIESRGHFFRAPDGSPRLRGLSIDVTQRHADQQDLVASEARYRVLADLNPNAIWMGDAQGNITYANHGFMAYIGLTPGHLGPTGWLEAFAPQERVRVQEV